MQLTGKKPTNKKLNLVPKNILLYNTMKVAEKIVAVVATLALIIMAFVAVSEYFKIGDLNREIAAGPVGRIVGL